MSAPRERRYFEVKVAGIYCVLDIGDMIVTPVGRNSDAYTIALQLETGEIDHDRCTWFELKIGKRA